MVFSSGTPRDCGVRMFRRKTEGRSAPGGGSSKLNLRCSFCGKTQDRGAQAGGWPQGVHLRRVRRAVREDHGGQPGHPCWTQTTSHEPTAAKPQMRRADIKGPASSCHARCAGPARHRVTSCRPRQRRALSRLYGYNEVALASDEPSVVEAVCSRRGDRTWTRNGRERDRHAHQTRLFLHRHAARRPRADPRDTCGRASDLPDYTRLRVDSERVTTERRGA